MTYTIKEIPLNDRPRERLELYGADILSSAELLAIVLGSGTKGKSVLVLAQEILAYFGDPSKINESSIQELCQVKGLGKAKAIQIKAAINLGIRAARTENKLKVALSTPSQAYAWIRDALEHRKEECFAVILQDTKGCAIRYEIISIGTLSNTLVHPREVFFPAIRHKAASIIIAHNHPSGDPTPSDNDYELTKLLINAGKTIKILVNDHLIIGHDKYVSLRQHGFSFE
ncbi:MAG: radC [Chlamydiales bacterium]|nr:radC [Chlamydiales bacterium]